MVENDPCFELEHEDIKLIAVMGSEELIDRIIEGAKIKARRRGKENHAKNIIERITS